jgi:hypothetical protein
MGNPITEQNQGTETQAVVEHPNRENPAPESAPAGADVPDGKTGLTRAEALILEAVRGIERGEWMAHLGPRVVVLPREEHDRQHEVILKLRAKIARLRAEVERLKGERDAAREAGGEARIAENKAEHARVSMSLRVTKMDAARAALALRVAEAVREAIRECQPSVSRHQWMSDEACTRAEAIEEWRKDIDAIDIAAIVATAIKEGE